MVCKTVPYTGFVELPLAGSDSNTIFGSMNPTPCSAVATVIFKRRTDESNDNNSENSLIGRVTGTKQAYFGGSDPEDSGGSYPLAPEDPDPFYPGDPDKNLGPDNHIPIARPTSAGDTKNVRRIDPNTYWGLFVVSVIATLITDLMLSQPKRRVFLTVLIPLDLYLAITALFYSNRPLA